MLADISIGELIVIGTCVVTITSTIVTATAAIKYISKRLDKLEEKQDKYNNLQERMKGVEDSSKSAHNRINDCSSSHGVGSNKIAEKLDQLIIMVKDSMTDHITVFHSK